MADRAVLIELRRFLAVIRALGILPYAALDKAPAQEWLRRVCGGDVPGVLRGPDGRAGGFPRACTPNAGGGIPGADRLGAGHCVAVPGTRSRCLVVATRVSRSTRPDARRWISLQPVELRGCPPRGRVCLAAVARTAQARREPLSAPARTRRVTSRHGADGSAERQCPAGRGNCYEDDGAILLIDL